VKAAVSDEAADTDIDGVPEPEPEPDDESLPHPATRRPQARTTREAARAPRPR
jgi:hypothetical protein